MLNGKHANDFDVPALTPAEWERLNEERIQAEARRVNEYSVRHDIKCQARREKVQEAFKKWRRYRSR